MVIDSGVTVMFCQSVIFPTHFQTLKMGRKNYTSCSQDRQGKLHVWPDSGHTESCFAVEFCLGKKKEKPLGAGEEPGDQWGGKTTYFGPKMNNL